MQELTTVSTSSSLTTSAQLSNTNLLQPLLTALGWQDLKPAIVAAEQADQALALELQQAYDAYSKTPDAISQQRLQMALDQTIGELQADLSRVKKLEKEAAKRLAKSQDNSSGYFASWGSWLKQSAQSFFGSDDASLIERYGDIAQKRQTEITQLAQLRTGLAAQVSVSTAEPDIIEEVISPLTKVRQSQTFSHSTVGSQDFTAADEPSAMARKLLQTNSTGTTTTTLQYCYPDGACELSALSSGNYQLGLVLQGEAAGDQSGISVSSAGDVNGDGVSDLLIGARFATPSGRSNAGKSYVVFGSSNSTIWGNGVLDLSTLRDGRRGLVLQGEAGGDLSGSSVSSAGDVNGDGLADLLIGAYQADPSGRSNAGKSYVVFGSSNSTAWGNGTLDLSKMRDGIRGFVLQGETSGDYSGFSVSSAGDVNGDGLADLLIGAFGADPSGRTDAGKSYVVFGSRNVAAWGNGTLELSAMHDGIRGFVLQGEGLNDNSGFSVNGAGDVNGDGIADLVVGARLADPGGRTDAGKSYVVFGSRNVTTWGNGVLELSAMCDGIHGFVLQGEIAYDNSGLPITSAGDMNGDGIADLIIGAYVADPSGRTDAGKSYVVFGSRNATAWGNGVLELSAIRDGMRGFVLQGEAAFDKSGLSIASAGDVNGDGIADLVIGASEADPSGHSGAGKSYVVFGSHNSTTWGNGVLDLRDLPNGIQGFVLQGELAGDYSGRFVNSAGDFNGDGFDDVIIGAYNAAPNGRSAAGKSYVVWGRASSMINPPLSIMQASSLVITSEIELQDSWNQPLQGTYFIQNQTAGQFELPYQNLPGQVISSFTQTQVSNREVIFVQDGSDNNPDYHLTLQASLGWSFSFALSTGFGSVQQQQYASVIDLSQLSNGFYGFVLNGESMGDASGYSVSAAGDINGDEVSDLVIGANSADPNGRTDAGKSYVLFGSRNATAWGNGVLELSAMRDGIRGFVLQGEAVGDQSGVSVSTASDMNGDGLDDLMVGANFADTSGPANVGKSYVVFGSHNATVWSNGVLELSAMRDGMRGFVLQGETWGDQSGYSVSSAGDINSDGFGDLIIGAYLADPNGRNGGGNSYVVFGSHNATAWSNGTLELRSLLNGVRGFVLQAETADDWNGYSVSRLGDINGDGVDDLVVGAPVADPNGLISAGKSYVVFGSNSSVWGNGTLELSSLTNGVRGFVLQGEATSDQSGYSVSDAGDINGDGLGDLVIGACGGDPIGRNEAGKSYVVFGSRNRTSWDNGVLNLSSSINGVFGFVLQGEVSGDQSGNSVSSAGDINGDSVADLIIGTHLADSTRGIPDAGKSYVVFGSHNSTAWGNGILDLSNLTNGVQGFALQGEAASDQSGFSVSGAGDINADGFDDLVIGAPYADPAGRTDAGKTYVVFGGRKSFTVAKQQLPLRSGQTLILGAQHFSVNYPNSSLVGNFIYTVQSITHGRFEYQQLPGAAITTFTQLDINQGKMQFVHDGSVEPPIYQLKVSDGVSVRMLPSAVNFNAHSVFVNNTLVLNQGQADLVTPDQLAVSDRESPVNYLTLSVVDQRFGQFEWVSNPGVKLTGNFVSSNITAGQIRFVPDGGTQAPEYTLSIGDNVNVYSERGQVNFNRAPTLGLNQLLVDQGQATVVTSSDLSASDPDTPSANLQFVVSNLQAGQFQYVANGTATSRFTQQAIFDGLIEFLHDGSSQAPSYAITVDDGRMTIPGRAATITFNHAPTLNVSRMVIDQGQPTVLRPQDISATDVETFDEDIIIEVGNVTHGYFSYSSNPTFVISAFRQFPLITGGVQFTQDGSNTNASFALRAFDGRIYTPWQVAQTRLNRRPVLQRNVSDIGVTQGESFSFDLGSDLFADPDDEPLNYTAQLEGGAPLPKGVEFIPPSSFQGNLPTLTSYQIEVQAQDPRGLKASTDFALQPQAPSQSGINLQALYTSVSSIGGIAVAIAGYFWLRRKTTAHRRGFELANNLRKAANLEYHDFMRFDGDVFKSKIDNFLTKLDLLQPGFYKELTPAEKKNFAVCIAEILEQRKLLTPSGYGMGIYGWMLAFSVGWSQQLDFKKFESQLDDIAKQAFTAWQAEASPTTRWQYFSPTCKDKVNAFCCARPSRAGMFARDKARLSRSEGVSLTDLKDSKHQVIDMSSSSQKDVLAQTTGTTSSPRFFDRSAATSEERLGLVEKQLQSHMQQVTEGMQYMHRSMQEVVGNVKTIHDEVEQLKAESRPLLSGPGSSS